MGSLSREGRGNLDHHPIHPHRISDVLDRLLTEIFIIERQLVLHLVVHRPRNEDPSHIGQSLQPCCNIHPVPVEVLSLGNYIPNVNSDAKRHLTFCWQLGILGFECLLDLNCALHGINDTGKLRQHAIPGSVYYPPSVLLDEGIGDLAGGGY